MTRFASSIVLEARMCKPTSALPLLLLAVRGKKYLLSTPFKAVVYSHFSAMSRSRVMPSALAALCLIGMIRSVQAEDKERTIVIDNAPARLRGIRPQLMTTTFSPDGKLLVTTAGWQYIDAQA